jgi:polygalacturonase
VEGTLLDGTLKPARGGYGRIKFGTESSGGFRNCTVANCTFRSCHGLALEMVDGGIMDNITINNLTMMDVRDCAIYITTGKRNRTPGLRRAEASAASSEISGGAGVGSASQQSASATQAGVTTNSRMRNILISNVIADGVDRLSGIQIMGLPEQPLEGIRLENIRLTSSGGGSARDAALHPAELGTGYPDPNRLGTMPAYGIFARHVRDLELANLHVDFRTDDLRPPIQCADVDGLDIDNFKAKLAAGVPSAVLADDVRGIAIRNSPVLSGVNAK